MSLMLSILTKYLYLIFISNCMVKKKKILTIYSLDKFIKIFWTLLIDVNNNGFNHTQDSTILTIRYSSLLTDLITSRIIKYAYQ